MLNRHCLLLLIFCAASTEVPAQIPVIRANSKSVSIRDGEYFDKNSWNLSPKAKPDIYTADRTRKGKWVTFYTDIDSIKIWLKPGHNKDFVILLNGKDSCYTRVQSAVPLRAVTTGRTDTIPFTLTSANAIALKARINDTAAYKLHFDLSAFGIRFTENALKGRLARTAIHKLEMGTLIWNKPQIRSTKLTATGMDGRLGWDLFDGKVSRSTTIAI